MLFQNIIKPNFVIIFIHTICMLNVVWSQDLNVDGNYRMKAVKEISIEQSIPDIFRLDDGNSFHYTVDFPSLGLYDAALKENVYSDNHKIDGSYRFDAEFFVGDMLIISQQFWYTNLSDCTIEGKQKSDCLKLMCYDNGTGLVHQYTEGLIESWYPMYEGEKHESVSAVSIQDNNYGMECNTESRLSVEVLGQEMISLPFGKFNAFHLKNIQKEYSDALNCSPAGSPFTGKTETSEKWFVPYIGLVKENADPNYAEIVSFKIDEGRLGYTTNTDNDMLVDIQELLIGTNRSSFDSDNDSCDDYTEWKGRRNPLGQDDWGDLNSDCQIDLEDSIILLKMLSENSENINSYIETNANKDHNTILKELIFILKRIAETVK